MGVVISRLHTLCRALVVLLVACGATASAATYTVTDIGTLGGSRSYASAINARGDVAGWSTLAGDTVGHAFLYQSRRKRLIDLDPRGADGASHAWAINDRGRVAGDIAPGDVSAPVAGHAALFVRRRIIDLGTPPGLPTASALGINHAGDVLVDADFVVGVPLPSRGFSCTTGASSRSRSRRSTDSTTDARWWDQ